MAPRHQRLDQRLHLRDVLGRARLHARRQHAERGDVLVELALGLLGDAANRLVQRQVAVLLRGPRVDLVVDVGDVAHVGDVVGPVDVPQQPEQHVEHDDGARVADMGVVVDGGPAHVHAHVGGVDGPERLLPPRQRVVERERHVTPGLWRGVFSVTGSGKEAAARQPSLARCNNAAQNIYAACARDSHGRLIRAFPCRVKAVRGTGAASAPQLRCIDRPV